MREKEVDPDAGAQFNIGLSTAMEIRKLLNRCNELAMRGMFTDWYNVLLALEREVSAEMKRDDPAFVEKYRQKVTNTLKSYDAFTNSKKDNLVYSEMHEYEKALRKVIKDRGLGMPDKEDDDGL